MCDNDENQGDENERGSVVEENVGVDLNDIPGRENDDNSN